VIADKNDAGAVEAHRNLYGVIVTTINTIVFVGYIFYGYSMWTSMNRSFVLDLIRGEEAVMKEEHQVKIKAAVRREVTVAKYRLEAANAELRAVRADPKRDMTAETRVLKAQKAASQRLAIAQKRLKENQVPLSERLKNNLPSTAVSKLFYKPVVEKTSPGSNRTRVKSTGLSSTAPRTVIQNPAETASSAAAPASGVTPVAPRADMLAALNSGPAKTKDDEVDSTA
jgi:hypothetical protein